MTAHRCGPPGAVAHFPPVGGSDVQKVLIGRPVSWRNDDDEPAIEGLLGLLLGGRFIQLLDSTRIAALSCRDALGLTSRGLYSGLQVRGRQVIPAEELP